MNKSRIKVLGLGLPLLAIAVAVMVFVISNSSDTTEAAVAGAKPPSVDLTCKLGPLGGDPQTKCSFDLKDEFSINGSANYAADLDGNGTAGYHAVDIHVKWPTGLGFKKKSSSLGCPDGGVPDKSEVLILQWKGSCEISFQAAQFPECSIQPDQPFPQAGCDNFNSFGFLDVNIEIRR